MKKLVPIACSILFAAYAMHASAWAATSSTQGSAGALTWNAGWKFLRADAAPDAADADWEAVSLPHTPMIEQPAEMAQHFQGLCSYHRHFAADPAWRGKKVMLRFDGAMQVAEVFLNGSKLTTHEGGYLPFNVDLTSHLRFDGDNLLAVRLDNRDNPLVPPGKPLAKLDFTYLGGLYRGATLLVKAPLHISDEFEHEAGGGVFVRTESIAGGRAVLAVRTDVRNDDAKPRTAAVRFVLRDAKGRAVAEARCPERSLAPGTNAAFNTPLTVEKPALWSPNHPSLYTLETRLDEADAVRETRSDRCGIRTVATDPARGLILNGEVLRVRGANRHQDCPWLGNALPDDAQWRDIKRLKDAGFNMLRLAHYPQSKAVMDACDELGLLTLVGTPGWQWWNDSPQFQDLARRNIREMIRWHRNHPSVFAWEVSLNETYGHDEFHKECCAIARAEYPGALCAGDSYGSKDVSHYDLPFCGWTGRGYDRPAAPGFEQKHTSFIREYGDNDTGISTRIFRRDGEETMLRQAWAHQWTHNKNNDWQFHIGDCLWVGVDHYRGCSQTSPISTCGVLDWNRLPKFSNFFFQSQRDPAQGPMAFIPHYWNARPSPARVVVFSNCDEVELRLNGKVIGRKKPDDGPDAPLGAPTPDEDMLTNYMKTGKTVQDFEKMIEERRKQPRQYPLFTGGNCRHLEHPPFTFPLVPYEAGTLEAVGFIGGKQAARFVRRTPGKPAALRLVVETLGRPAAKDAVDAVFVRAEVVDAVGEVLPSNDGKVTFEVSGPADLVSPAEAPVEAGTATALLRTTGAKGKLQIKAVMQGMTPATASVREK